MSAPAASRRRRFTAAAIGAGLTGTLAVSLSLTGSLSGFIATITNDTNTAATATLAVAETSGSATCNSYDTTSTCSTINKYGGAAAMVPGDTQTVTVKFANTGTVAVGTSNLTPGTCTATSTGAVGASTPTTPNTTAGNLCSVLTVKVYAAATATGTPIYSGSPANFGTAVTLGALAKNANQSYTFVTTLPSTATTAVQGQQVSQQLVWTFNQ